MDRTLIRESVEIGIRLTIRGTDAIYVALAQRLGIPLVTWDNEQIQRGGPLIDVLTTSQALARMV
jgi:predicted nucleic acid-binding protein